MAVLDTNIWTTVSPGGRRLHHSRANAFAYPGGAAYQLTSLFPSGTLTVAATAGTTLLGSTPWDATDTLVSVQVTPVGSTGSATDANGNPVIYGTGLDGSELTQVYIESLKNTGYYAMIRAERHGVLLPARRPGRDFHQDHRRGQRVRSQRHDAYWMITEQGGAGRRVRHLLLLDQRGWQSLDAAMADRAQLGCHRTAGSTSPRPVRSRPASPPSFQNLNSNVTTPSYQGNLYLGQPPWASGATLLDLPRPAARFPFVTTQLSATADSFGNAWTDTQNVQVTNGTDLYRHAAVVLPAW